MTDDNSIDLTVSYKMSAAIMCAAVTMGGDKVRALACEEITEWGQKLDKASATIAMQRDAMKQALFALETLINLQGLNELIPYAKNLRATLEKGA